MISQAYQFKFQKSIRKFSRNCVDDQQSIWISQRVQRGIEKRSLVQLNPPALLRHVRVVLVAPKSPENIGAAARLCENFECPNLVLVEPRCDPKSEKAVVVSCGSPVLGDVKIYNNLRDALKDCNVSIAFTRRKGQIRATLDTPEKLREVVPDCFDVREEKQDQLMQTALIFGREESGLTEPEIQQCGYTCAINSGRQQPSLNLSHAVAIILERTFNFCLESVSDPSKYNFESLGSMKPPAAAPPTSTQQDINALVDRWTRIFQKLGMKDECWDSSSGARKRGPAAHLRSILLRAQTNTMEIQIFHGIGKAIEKELELQSNEEIQDKSSQIP